MKDKKKVIYVGRTTKYFTELKEYEVLGEYSDGCVLVIDDRKVKWTIPQGWYVVKN